MEECLRIKKDRAITAWKSELGKENYKKRKKKAQEVITEDFEVDE